MQKVDPQGARLLQLQSHVTITRWIEFTFYNNQQILKKNDYTNFEII